ncbi:metal ABC transporter ATP-binding protein [Actinomycetospora sp. OC33-EN08]|uniref:Metal ABC transporter ATP-binding protein n=1 Tax=Actinomycetospora aurantiaca TaxID=3129233 RepID=A0ABU8MI33_9PSEU
MTAGDQPVLRIRDLSVRYGEVLALDGVDLDLSAGTLGALLGVNGSGKSTLFNAVMGLVRPQQGEVRVLDGPSDRARRAGRIAYMPQVSAVDWTFPVLVRDVVTMGRYGRMGFRRRASRADRAAVDEALERVDLADLADRQIGALSGGQRQRVFLARALAQQASLLLLDEPFAGVDARSQATISSLLRELRTEGATLLVATHDLAGVGRLCDRAVLLQQRVLAAGPPEEVLTPEVLSRVFGFVTDETRSA